MKMAEMKEDLPRQVLLVAQEGMEAEERKKSEGEKEVEEEKKKETANVILVAYNHFWLLG
jgi:hypothetical protein